MTTTETHIHPVAGPDLVAAAQAVGPDLAARAHGHDLDGTFVADNIDQLRQRGYLASPVPVELGGGGATTAEVARAQLELARHCASTALTTTMHLHVVLLNAWRWRQGHDDAAALLRRVAEEGLVVASTGGGDFTRPTGVARAVDGGWRVSGHKAFVSGVTASGAAAMWATSEDGEAIGFGLPLATDGVTIVETWDAPGMRGTGSHDVVLDEVFVGQAQVTARRAPGEFAPVLAVLAAKALVVIAATYLGTAVGARDALLDALEQDERRDPGRARRLGEITQHLAEGQWALDGVLADLGDDPEPTPDTFVTATLAKRAIIDHARAVGDLAMDVIGGRGYRRGQRIERAWRDLRAGPFHPVDHEQALRLAGDHALGRPLDLS
jgi:alkylation response protein AidB-like acyl-CoA dehydrogenase